MTDKITMAQIWEEFDPIERAGIAAMLGIPEGQLSLMKVSNVFKGVFYRYHDREQIQQQINQMPVEQMRQQYAMKVRLQQVAQSDSVAQSSIDPSRVNESIAGLKALFGFHK